MDRRPSEKIDITIEDVLVGTSKSDQTRNKSETPWLKSQSSSNNSIESNDEVRSDSKFQAGNLIKEKGDVSKGVDKKQDTGPKMILKVERIFLTTSFKAKDGKETTIDDFIENACCFYIKQDTENQPEDVPAITMKRKLTQTWTTIDGERQKPEIHKSEKIEFGENYKMGSGNDAEIDKGDPEMKPKPDDMEGGDPEMKPKDQMINEKECVLITVCENVVEFQASKKSGQSNNPNEKLESDEDESNISNTETVTVEIH